MSDSIDIQEQSSNIKKYYNYREQKARLKRAINAEFYLEAVFIEYAIMEDRLQSILEKAGVFNPEKHQNIGKKISRIRELIRSSKNPLNRYITKELLDSIFEWKNKRNDYVHRLLNESVTTEEIKNYALNGNEIVKTLSSKATLYKRYLQRREDNVKICN